MEVVSSRDQGETWERQTLITNPDLFNMSKGFISFNDDHGYISILSYVSINSHVMTLFETFDKGVTWQKGETPNVNAHIFDSSMLEDTLYFTYNNQTSLFITRDLGQSYIERVIPAAQLEESMLTDGLAWEDIFIQAEAPRMENGLYVMYVNQGEHWDYRQNSKAKYISRDQGEHWMFDSFVIPKTKEPLN